MFLLFFVPDLICRQTYYMPLFSSDFLDIRDNHGSLTVVQQTYIIATLLNPLEDRQFMDQVNFAMKI